MKKNRSIGWLYIPFVTLLGLVGTSSTSVAQQETSAGTGKRSLFEMRRTLEQFDVQLREAEKEVRTMQESSSKIQGLILALDQSKFVTISETVRSEIDRSVGEIATVVDNRRLEKAQQAMGLLDNELRNAQEPLFRVSQLCSEIEAEVNLMMRGEVWRPLTLRVDTVIGDMRRLSNGLFPGAVEGMAPEKLSSYTQEKLMAVLALLDMSLLKRDLVQLVKEKQKGIESLRTKGEAHLQKLKSEASTIAGEIGKAQEGQIQVDTVLMQYGLPAIGFILIALIAAPHLYWKNPELQNQIFRSGILLDAFTVFILSSSIVLLGIGGKIESNVLGTLFAGISGYVLGRSRKRSDSNQP